MILQPEIVLRVAGLFALADPVAQRLEQARKQVDKLTPSLPPPRCYGAELLKIYRQ